MAEALLYEQVGDDEVACQACHHRCVIRDGHTGICGVRYNEGGRLYALNYGKAISAAVDPIEKKPLYHFLPGSEILSIAAVGCNFRCAFCQNADISQYGKDARREISGFDLPPERVVGKALDLGCPSIAYTYTEPAVFIEYAHDTAKLAKDAGLKNVFISNGYQSKESIDLVYPYLDAANIDLKSFSDEFYRRLCGAKLEHVLETIRYLHELGVWLEITTLVIPTENDSADNLKQIAEFIASLDSQIPWHISRFSPAHKMQDLPPTTFAKLQEAYRIGQAAGLKNVYIGNYPTRDFESTYCPNCHELVIERESYHVVNKIENGKCWHCDTKISGVF